MSSAYNVRSPHPGLVIRESCHVPLGLTVTAAAQGLPVNRKALSELLDGRSGVSLEIAVRLAKALGGSAESWPRQQLAFDLWQARQPLDKIEVKRFGATDAPEADRAP